MNEITVRVPATTANLGPGYDCLGVALALFNRVTIRRGPATTQHPMATATATAFFKTAGCERFDIAWRIEGDVPQSRGLGSSVTVRLGLLHGLNELADRPLDTTALYKLCAALEGHPDNAAPAAFGGFTVASPDGWVRFEVLPALHFILLIPPFEVSTPEARKILPAQVTHAQAVTSCANACRITAAFAAKEYERLRGAFEDYLHQPARTPLVPFLPAVIAAGEEAGALGGFLSGSGSTIACLTMDDPEQIAEAMLAASGIPDARTVITHASNEGVRIQ